MHSREDDVLDAAGYEQIICLLAAISNRVGFRDLDARDLPRPCVADRALDRAVTAHVRIVDGQVSLTSGVRPAPGRAPALGGRKGQWWLSERGYLRPISLRGVVVKIHDGAWGVNDEHALVARRFH